MNSDKKIPRRAFMRMLPMVPVAAKGAAESAAAQASGVSVIGKRRFRYPDHGSDKIEKHIFGLLKDGKAIPETRRRSWLRSAKNDARLLDPDISSMRSVSLSQKVQMQAQRNYDRQVGEFMENHVAGEAWRAMVKSLGVDPDEW